VGWDEKVTVKYSSNRVRAYRDVGVGALQIEKHSPSLVGVSKLTLTVEIALTW
jgi:hypothetical protein